MVEIVKYNATYKVAWDAFVAASRNGTFMLQRNFIEYHEDRFTDHSLLVYYKEKLLAVLPANEAGQELQSHGGLSYGGLVYGQAMKAELAIEVLKAIVLYLQQHNFKKLYYKAIPHIYHSYPTEEDLYALFKLGARLVRRDVNSVILLNEKLPLTQLRQRKLKTAQESGLTIKQSIDYEEFMQVEAEVLETKYNLKPAHTAEEITRLAKIFPENIKLYEAYKANQLLAGTIVFETPQVAHCQYIAATEEGKNVAALDLLFNELTSKVYNYKKYFSFGISTEQQGQVLNYNLARFKESFGARTITHDFYEIEL